MATKRTGRIFPKSIKVRQEKRTYTLKIYFASISGKESDKEAQAFLTKLRRVLKDIRCDTDKLEIDYTLKEKLETRHDASPFI
jgi:hypothetical protein